MLDGSNGVGEDEDIKSFFDDDEVLRDDIREYQAIGV
jgi:hypothetical protein